jgi:signal transduction histidine kinase
METQSLGDRHRLALLISRARWASIVFGLVEALVSDPPPISRAGLLTGLAISALYNVPAGMPHRFSARGLEWLLAATLTADFLVVSNAIALAANAPNDNAYLLWVLPGLEAALLFEWRGALAFSAGFLVAFSLWVAERKQLYDATATPGQYIFGAVTMLIVAGFAAGMTAIAQRSARVAAAQAAQIARAYTETQDLNQQLSDFLNALVHEMRSPLTVVSGYAEMLRDPAFASGPDAAHALDAIVAKADTLNEIVEELLVTARLEAGRLDLEGAPVPLGDAVRAAAGRAADRARLTKMSIVVADVSGDVVAVGDRPAIDRILDNLLANALTYGGRDTAVEVSAGADGTACSVRVRDHGVGVPAGMEERIFDRFVRAHEATHRRGSGLGLYVARALARRMHGELAVERSAPGEGSVFLVTLPRAPSPAPEPSDHLGRAAGAA